MERLRETGKGSTARRWNTGFAAGLRLPFRSFLGPASIHTRTHFLLTCHAFSQRDRHKREQHCGWMSGS
jgi:hypothetical protein